MKRRTKAWLIQSEYDMQDIDIDVVVIPDDFKGGFMDQELKSVIDKALNMSHENRALIVDRLIDSLDVNSDHDVEAAWQQLIQKRIAESERGEAKFISWDVAKEKLQLR